MVTRVQLINPHSWIHIDVKGPDGKIEWWAIEAGSPNILMRRGITKDTLKVGQKISLMGTRRRMVRREQTAGTLRFRTARSCSSVERVQGPHMKFSGLVSIRRSSAE